MKLRPVVYATGLTLSTDGKLRILPLTDRVGQREIVIMERQGRDAVRWSISVDIHSGCCLNRDGDWEYEPVPSSRDDEFYARCRFPSFEDAVAFLRFRSFDPDVTPTKGPNDR